MLQLLAQHPDVLHRAGLASAVLSIYAFWPYISDILAGRTRPERASWLIWALLSAVSLLAQIYEGADGSLGFAVTQTLGTVVICGLTFWKTTQLRFKTEDSQVLTATAVGIWLWAEMESAVYSLFVTISMSMMGGLLTMKKAFLDPTSETWATWAAFFVSAALAVVAIGQADWLLMAYPLYVMALSGGIMAAMGLGHLRVARRQADAPQEQRHQRLTLSVMSFQRAGSPTASE
ncbi:hypothetical protein [uncultured Tateyamaria sp.]|uniref:hypothetical protein n=1 Tax=uncultured Tateyamaria sp. TaxID=455651 RepID=UPI0026298918|nr:hypothetical protein [uncultured Tateyamaria sp.]